MVAAASDGVVLNQLGVLGVLKVLGRLGIIEELAPPAKREES